MKQKNKRLDREKRTVKEMILLYCHNNHGTKGDNLCESCQSLLDYAFTRIDRCVFLPDKPTCKNCTVHCYAPAKKQAIKDVMRYSGPRMMWHKPILAIHHLLDGKKDKERIENYFKEKEKRKK